MTRLQQIAEALKCPVAYLFRTHDELTEERAATIAELMHGLPEDGQEALVDVVAMAAKVMRQKQIMYDVLVISRFLFVAKSLPNQVVRRHWPFPEFLAVPNNEL